MSRPVAAACAAVLFASSALAQTDSPDLLKQAAALFRKGKESSGNYALAAAKFAAAFAGRVEFTPEHLQAWAYCRVKVAADRLNKSPNDPTVAAEVLAEVEEAVKLAPTNAGLQQVGAQVMAAARPRAGSAPARPADPATRIETASFVVIHSGNRPLAEAVAKAAESHRNAIFARWAEPPAGAWKPKCEITLHATADAFAATTRQPAEATGRAVVTLDAGRVTARRLDLRADDDTIADDALPRELTHVVLADLFPYRAPAMWAEEGMAVLAMSAAERDRYRRTLARCYRDRELFPLATLFEQTAPPANRATGFHVESASLVEFLVRWKGGPKFKTFVGDSQRYGVAAALQREYGVDVKGLEQLWLTSELAGGTARAQAP
jgi:hypothetical protein